MANISIKSRTFRTSAVFNAPLRATSTVSCSRAR